MKTLALLALCGCDSLFGFATVPAVTPDASVDGAPRTVQCDYLWHVVTTDPMGVPSVMTLAAMPGYAHVKVGGREVPIGADGTFSFTAEVGKPYELELDLPGGSAFFDRDSDTCHLMTGFFQRQSGAPSTLPTQLTIVVGGPPPANANVFLASTGVRVFATPTVSAPSMTSTSYTVDWKKQPSLDAKPAFLLDASTGDRLFWEQFDITTDYDSLTRAAEASVTLVDGGAFVYQVAPAAVPQRCVTVTTQEGTIGDMLVASSLRPNGALSSSWAIVSSPAPQIGITEHQPLARTRATDVGDHTAKVSYGNPFVGETDVFQIGVALAHTVAVPSASAIPIYTSLVAYDLPMADASGTTCNASIAVPVPPVAMAIAPTVAGSLLASDNQPVTIDRSTPVPVHVDLTSGPQDSVMALLVEVGASAGTTAITPVATYYPLAQDFTIDPSLLLVGHTYLLYIGAQRGLPHARDKFDFTQITYPSAESFNPSTTFRIAN